MEKIKKARSKEETKTDPEETFEFIKKAEDLAESLFKKIEKDEYDSVTNRELRATVSKMGILNALKELNDLEKEEDKKSEYKSSDK